MKRPNRLRTCAFAFCIIAVPLLSDLPGFVTQAEAGTFRAANSTEVRETRNKIRASQFLSKATFGPTEEMITDLATRIGQIGYRGACSQWIDEQFALPATSHEQTSYDIIANDGRIINQTMGIGYGNYRTQAWWHVVLTADDQLRQRVAWSLSQIFSVGDGGTGFNQPQDYNIGGGNRSIPLWAGLANYYDLMVTHADGNYRDLLGDVTFHGNMGVWLSSLGNVKAVYNSSTNKIDQYPDENYAREIMQLFSVGLYELEQDGRLRRDANLALVPTYSNDGITELARVFTGFHYADNNNDDTGYRVGNGQRNWGEAMAVKGDRHDNNKQYTDDDVGPQSKTVFGQTLPALPTNYDSLTGSNANRALQNQAATDEINAALDIIAGHENVGPFIARRLIQRMVKSNPSRAYMRRVTAVWSDNGNGERGDLAAVVKAILLDPEVFRGQSVRRARDINGKLLVQVKTRGTEYSRLREPVVRVTSLIRAMRPRSNYPGGYMMLTNDINNQSKQGPYKNPTVFNFYLPDYATYELGEANVSRRQPYTELFSPEFEILDASTSVAVADRMKGWCRNRYVQYNMTNGAGACRITFDLDAELQMARDDSVPGNIYTNVNHNKGRMKDLLERFDLLLCNGSLSEETKEIIYNALATVDSSNNNHDDGPNQNEHRVEEMLLAIATSPDCAVEE